MERRVDLVRGVNVAGRGLAMSNLRVLQARAENGERVGRAGDAPWMHSPNGIARSKLSPLLIEKPVDSPATSRNWRTVARLREMLAG